MIVVLQNGYQREINLGDLGDILTVIAQEMFIHYDNSFSHMYMYHVTIGYI